MDPQVLDRFEEHLRTEMPTLKVRFKNESLFFRVLRALMVFSPKYRYWCTVVGTTVYFTTREWYLSNPELSIRDLAHAYTRIYDTNRNRWFKISYLFPQILAVLPLALYGWVSRDHVMTLAIPVLGYLAACLIFKLSDKLAGFVLGFVLMSFFAIGCAQTGWWSALILASAVMAAPWPAPWRVGWELRGYGMEVAIRQWIQKTHDVEWIFPELFVGPAFYYMSWNRSYVAKNLEATRQQAEAGVLQQVAPYSTVYEFLSNNMLVDRV